MTLRARALQHNARRLQLQNTGVSFERESDALERSARAEARPRWILHAPGAGRWTVAGASAASLPRRPYGGIITERALALLAADHRPGW